MLFAGVWYNGVDVINPQPGLELSPDDVQRMATTAPGVAVTWEHSAVDAIQNAPVGSERVAAMSSGKVIGTVVCSWVDTTGAARVVFRVNGTCVCGLLTTGILGYLSATHVVGTPEMLELSLTREPARPRCNIDGIGIPTVASYIAKHPPRG